MLEIFKLGKSHSFENKFIALTLGRLTGHESDINIDATVAKYHRTLNNDNTKRGKARDTYRAEIFNIPTSTVSSAQLQAVEEAAGSATSSSLETSRVSEKQKVISEQREHSKQLKRKIDRRDVAIEGLKAKKSKHEKLETELHREKKKTEQIEKQLQKKTAAHTSTKVDIKSLRSSLQLTNRKMKTAECTVDALNRQNQQLIYEKQSLEDNVQSLKTENKELNRSNEYLQDLINDNPDVNLLAEGKNELVQCAINLTNLKVATKNVSAVIQEVGKLCGKNFTNLPTRQTVDNFVDRKIAISQKQVGSVLSHEKDTTLYTDETRKHGHTYETYIISDESDSYLVLEKWSIKVVLVYLIHLKVFLVTCQSSVNS